MPENGNRPFTYDMLIQAEEIALSTYDNHITRRLSSWSSPKCCTPRSMGAMFEKLARIAEELRPGI